MQKRNLAILVVCQVISATGSIVIVTLGGVLGATLAEDPAWATLPLSMMVVATAATTIPATLLMRRFGRPRGFALASLSSAVAVLVAAQAIAASHFWLFIAAAMLFGINMAFTQQYRYAAAESVPSAWTGRAVSFVLLGPIIGAIVGPELAVRGRDWVGDVPYAGTMYALAVLYGMQALLFTQLRRGEDPRDAAPSAPGRPLGRIVGQRTYLVAVLGGTAGYGLMTLVMTATPISMHVHNGYSMEQTASVIQWHVLGMYLPSLVSGYLIDRLGVVHMMFAGALALLATAVVGLQGQSYMHYWWALVLLGGGWNLLYVGGTTMLTYTYSAAERFRAQAVNEFLVFGISATTSLLAGTILYHFGWFRLMLIPIPVLIVVCVTLLMVRRDRTLRTAEAL